MAGILRGHMMNKYIALGLFVVPSVSFSYCINPVITWSECDFKNEDTNLSLNQPAKHHRKNEDVERILSDSAAFIDVYYNTVKTNGDAEIIADTMALAAELRKIQVTQIYNTATMLDNDPYSLKEAYTDLVCEAKWAVIDATWNSLGYPVGDRDCPTTSDLLVDVKTIKELNNRAKEIEDIVKNQFRNLGDVWGDMEEDVQRFEEAFNSPETLSRNLLPDQIVTKYDETYSSFEQMITNPVMDADAWTVKFKAMDETVNQTIRDTLLATQANAKSMLGKQAFQTVAEAAADTTPNYTSDVDELRERNQKSRDSVGRMQQAELKNMAASLSGQAWVDITSQQNATGMMMGNDMAKDAAQTNYQQSLSVHMRKELQPLADRQVFGDEPAYRP